jgi:hypothetical protein
MVFQLAKDDARRCKSQWENGHFDALSALQAAYNDSN